MEKDDGDGLQTIGTNDIDRGRTMVDRLFDGKDYDWPLYRQQIGRLAMGRDSQQHVWPCPGR